MENPEEILLPPVRPQRPHRWARDYLFDVCRELGITRIFGVPGVNEIPWIDGTSYPENGVEYVECLHENIAMGAAMGSSRMTGKPAILIVHVTPGIAHAITNLFNASRSQFPLIILCAQQQNALVVQEPLLSSDTVPLARNYCKWAHEMKSEDDMKLVLQRAFKEAMAPPNGAVFLSVPWEFTMRRIPDGDRLEGITRISPRFGPDPDSVRDLAGRLAAAKNPLIVAGDAVGLADAWKELRDLAHVIGAPVLQQALSAVANYPNNDSHWQGELPNNQAGMQSAFKDHDVAFLCGFSNQAQVLIYKPSDGPLIPDSVSKLYLSNCIWDIGKNYHGDAAVFADIKVALPQITTQVNAVMTPLFATQRNERNRTLAYGAVERSAEWQQYLDRAMNQDNVWAVVIADALRRQIEQRHLQDNFVYVHEAISDPSPFQYLLPFAKPTSYYSVGGGSLGWSFGATIGIKEEERGVQGIGTKLVVAVTGDGSSLFYPQAWWTAAHRNLGILYIITNNSEYHTLQVGLGTIVQVYGEALGYDWKPRTMDPGYLTIRGPQPDFVGIAKAMAGIEGRHIAHPDEVGPAVAAAVRHVLETGKSFVLEIKTVGLSSQQQPPDTIDDRVITPSLWTQPHLDWVHSGPGSARRPGDTALIC
ncbi:thiamine pyrophosphate enzyme, N-terminal TPP binding domain-containing protein [Chaetomium sp. MPI-SDFR-AT-0129]|nr:thiamine pyrophosphate enzyme, N-terminal TPP binding domain-containing protein [Chaetomium sp. MPI-SDFR-AT-0129]